MNKINKIKLIGILLTAIFTLSLVSCKEQADNRAFEGVKIVGVKVDGSLFTPTYTVDETIVVLPGGMDLSKVKLELLVANGELVSFVNGNEYDARVPMMISLKGFDGTSLDTKLRIQSPPKLASFIINGIEEKNINRFEGDGMLVVQVPKGTNLTNLSVIMEYLNGTLIDFTNGSTVDYTNPLTFKILGADGETVYTYELIITTDEVGPAVIKAIAVNDIVSDSVVVKANNVVVPYIPSLMNFTSVNVTLTTGFGNKVDPAFTGTGLNLMTGANKVKVTGTNGVVTEFTIGVPQISFTPLFIKKYADLSLIGFGANDASAVGFSGNNLLVSNYTSATKLPAYFDFTGNKIANLDATGVDPTGYGIRKFATDEKGNILCLSLGMSANEQWVYRYNAVTGQGTTYLSFSKASLGVDYNPRSAGISITGSLDGDALITIPIAQKQEVFVWKVTGGVLNPTPVKYGFPYVTSFYWSVQPMPIGKTGYVSFSTSTGLNGILSLDQQMGEIVKLTGMPITDGDVVVYKNRTYIAYTVQSADKAIMRICDITGGTIDDYQNPIFDLQMVPTGANANVTVDADFSIIDGKLYAAFSATNVGVYLYCFDK